VSVVTGTELPPLIAEAHKRGSQSSSHSAPPSFRIYLGEQRLSSHSAADSATI